MKPATDDPFGERRRVRARTRLSVLGADFTAESDETALIELAVNAFDGLPKYRLDRRPHRLNVRLVLTNSPKTWPRGSEPPRPLLSAGAGLISATVDMGNFAVVDVRMSRALVGISAGMLRHPYHARYELIELAFVTLASRAQSLVPLHAACIGTNGSGVLVMGASGTGKSTLSLHALAGGMKLLSEDSTFVHLERLRVVGVPNYLHLQPDALSFLCPGVLRQQICESPMIQRRSGTRKFEVDLREMQEKIAHAPLQLAATVFLTRRPAGRRPALRPLKRETFLARLRREQPYAKGQPGWRDFERHIVSIPSYELRRTEHPDDSVSELRALLD